MEFSELNLAPEVLRAVEAEKYATPSPIQEQAIPHLLAGRDVLGCAQTGTGKTAAFALPIINALHAKPNNRRGRAPRALVLAPTRELAAQVGASFAAFGKFAGVRSTVIYGGVGQGPQVSALRSGIDVLVATPGRLADLLNQKHVDLRSVEMFVLDEADHMLDLGFIHDVRNIISRIPEKRQTLLFSATMPKEISSLADSILRDPVKVAVAPVSSPVESVEQSVYHAEKANKGKLLVDILQNGVQGGYTASLIFSRTKHGADKICKMLNANGIKAAAIHGNKSQSARNDALGSFKRGTLRALVATDIAARGIDVRALPLVVNYDLPDVPETYVHRIGRTGRAGLRGTAVSFCDGSERAMLRDIERLTGRHIPAVRNHPLASGEPLPETASPALERARRQPRQARPQPQQPRSNRPARPARAGAGRPERPERPGKPSRPGQRPGGRPEQRPDRNPGQRNFRRAAS